MNVLSRFGKYVISIFSTAKTQVAKENEKNSTLEANGNPTSNIEQIPNLDVGE